MQPSEALLSYFRTCDDDVTSAVVRRVQDLSNCIFPLPQGPSGVAFLQSTMARERRLEVSSSPRPHDSFPGSTDLR